MQEHSEMAEEIIKMGKIVNSRPVAVAYSTTMLAIASLTTYQTSKIDSCYTHSTFCCAERAFGRGENQKRLLFFRPLTVCDLTEDPSHLIHRG